MSTLASAKRARSVRFDPFHGLVAPRLRDQSPRVSWEDIGLLLVRIAVGAGLGAIIGYERDFHGRPVGLRTHTLVAMASATFMVVSAHFMEFQDYPEDLPVEADVSRIAASVVSAVGFLAGGAILRHGASIRGLTTAAGLWLVTAIGLAAGSGMYGIAVPVTAMGIVALTLMRRFEDKDDRTEVHRVFVEATDLDVKALMAQLEALGAEVTQIDHERRRGEKKRTSLRFAARLPRSVTREQLLDALEETSDLHRVQIGEPS